MSIIIGAISPRAYELIRDRIGSILADELPNQSALNGGDPNLNPKVFIERFVPPSDEEMPMVNVECAKGDYGLITAISQDGTYQYHIDVHTKSKTSATDRGDSMSAVLCQRLVGVIHAILSDAKYRTLGFAKPFIEHVEVTDIQFAAPVNGKDASSVMMGRLTFTVRVPENVEAYVPTLIDGYDTTVELGNTNDGYVFSGNNAPIPPPTCDPATITDGASTIDVPSGGAYTCQAGVKSGIAYCRPPYSQTTSYRVGDAGWHFQNGSYVYTPPTNPVSVAAIDYAVNYRTLKENNAFGNKERFTAADGSQVYSDNYFIDHLTGLGYWWQAALSSWTGAIDNAVAATDGGFSDWRIPTISEMNSVADMESIKQFESGVAPFNVNIPNGVYHFSSETQPTNPSFHPIIGTSGGTNVLFTVTSGLNTPSRYYLFVRNHY